jgi:hypothetical protein
MSRRMKLLWSLACLFLCRKCFFIVHLGFKFFFSHASRKAFRASEDFKIWLTYGPVLQCLNRNVFIPVFYSFFYLFHLKEKKVFLERIKD